VLSVTRPCWVSASVDGERQIERLLQPGERQTIDVRREMIITAGDASAITLTLNGAPAKPLGKTGDVVTARFNRANYKDYLQAR
jgi:putative aminopeptidase FrvX